MRHRLLSVAAVAACVWVSPAAGDWKADIGYTRLVAELAGEGVAAPTGAGITASHVEAPDNGDDYAPDTGIAEFAGKSFTLKSGASGVSSHATTVGTLLYGASSSIAPDIDTIDNWEADHWLAGGLLNMAGGDPLPETRRIQNHSWVGDYANDATAAMAIRRFDYTIDRDNYVAVVGLSNGGSQIPDLLGHSYNAITVGRTDGGHCRGSTRFDAPGRIKPDIVVPQSATSWAAPVVGAAAAMLLEMADNDPALSDAGNCEAVKAILLAGATKNEFAGWDRTHTRPLDDVYGAGELNVYRSYQTVSAGRQGSDDSDLVGPMGWDFDTLPAAGEALYFFEIGGADFLNDSSIVLAWNRRVIDLAPGVAVFNPSVSLADLDLELWTADGFTLDQRLDYSASAVDNVEHIWAEDLAAGRYAIRVLAGTTGGQYALAWYSRELPRGDVNGDGNVDNLDVTPLVDALINDQAAFLSAYPDGAYWAADTTADGSVDNLDITPLVHLLTGGATPVPEPATIASLALAALILPMRWPAGRRGMR